MDKKIILCVAFLLFFLFFLVFIFVSPPDTDIKIYFNYSESILQNKTPYKDFFVAYPPLSLLPIILPGIFAGDITTYKNIFGLEMFIFLILIIYFLYLFSKKLKKDYFLIVLSFLLLAPFLSYTIVKRFDVFVAFLTMLNVYLLIDKKYYLSVIILVLGFFTKFYPIILLPLFFLYILKKESIKKALYFVAFFALTFYTITIPFFLISPLQGSNIYSFTYHFTRPLHFESLYGSTLLLLEKTKIPLLQTTFKNDIYGWTLYDSPLINFILPFSTLFILGILLFLLYIFSRKEKISNNSLLKYIFAFLLVFIVFNKVLSPQFLIWILPFVVLVLNPKEFKIFLTAALLTFFLYPPFYKFLVEKQTWALILLFARNLLLVFLTFLLIPKNYFFQAQKLLREKFHKKPPKIPNNSAT